MTIFGLDTAFEYEAISKAYTMLPKNCLGQATESFSPGFVVYDVYVHLTWNISKKDQCSDGCLQVFIFFYCNLEGSVGEKKAATLYIF